MVIQDLHHSLVFPEKQFSTCWVFVEHLPKGKINMPLGSCCFSSSKLVADNGYLNVGHRCEFIFDFVVLIVYKYQEDNPLRRLCSEGFTYLDYLQPNKLMLCP
jgi:hypothetical protein